MLFSAVAHLVWEIGHIPLYTIWLEGTWGEIAFAIVEAERESSAAYRRAAALQRLYRLAREAGSIGADRAAPAVLKKEAQ